MTQEQIKYYSELMAKFVDIKVRYYGSVLYHCDEDGWIDFKDATVYSPHRDRNDLHEVWEKFRDLKVEYPNRYLFLIDEIRFKLTDCTLEEAFLELGKGIEWYYSLKK